MINEERTISIIYIHNLHVHQDEKIWQTAMNWIEK